MLISRIGKLAANQSRKFKSKVFHLANCEPKPTSDVETCCKRGNLEQFPKKGGKHQAPWFRAGAHPSSATKAALPLPGSTPTAAAWASKAVCKIGSIQLLGPPDLRG